MSIRNFCIIAHIDHGKSTLADRFLEITQTVQPRKMKEQLLDVMDIEREKGITIKLQPVRMNYYSRQGKKYTLNLIDTPGHVDFSYEVSRSLAAVEGAILLVDATQGIQAQTLANLYMALEEGLSIIPVVNKIDLPNADREGTTREIKGILGQNEEIFYISAKTGRGVKELLDAIIKLVPPPVVNQEENFKALIFDSAYDSYKGIILFVRIFDGRVSKDEQIMLIGSGAETEIQEVGYFHPEKRPSENLIRGEIGYIATGLKEIKLCRVGDTVILKKDLEGAGALPGYKPSIPMVYAGVYPTDAEKYEDLRDALNKLNLNDAAFTFEPESSTALGRGFKIGCLGLLHLEIIKERISREFLIEVIITAPSVKYRVKEKSKDNWLEISSASQMPNNANLEIIEEPWVETEIITPRDYLGVIIKLLENHRGIYQSTEFLQAERAIIRYQLPLAEVIMNFYDKLKSISSGFGSLNYAPIGFRRAELAKLDILIAGELKESLSRIVPTEKAYSEGKSIVKLLKKTLPKQQFAVSIQAAVGGKILARETLSAIRKDVTAKLYGGDRTRKDKLLNKQKKGKKRLKESGKVNIPSSVYLKLMKK
ncbi:MAG: elongation factor 4 [Candidatus Moranbacteria bacterium]|nr:elongation factor 4 [Candidatus Moranbacteria bacterium]